MFFCITGFFESKSSLYQSLKAQVQPVRSSVRFHEMLRPLSPVVLCLLAGLGQAVVLLSSPAALAEDDFYIDTAQRETVRKFYQSVFWSSEQVEPGWNGSLVYCDPGSLSPEYQAATIRRVNWFRAMAGVPADVGLDDLLSADAQQAALVLSANRSLAAPAQPSSRCHTPTGEQAARHASLTLGAAGPEAVLSQFMALGDTATGVKYRSSILFPWAHSMGAGAIPAATEQLASGVLAVEDTLNAGAQPPIRDGFVAWPPPGFVPYSTVFPRWSFAYADADFSYAEVRMWRDGAVVPVARESQGGEGAEDVLVWTPVLERQGSLQSRPASDEGYRVEITSVLVDGKLRDFQYFVTLFDPAHKGAEYAPQTITGTNTPAVGEQATYSFTQVAGADSYQWRAARLSPEPAITGEESALAQQGIAVGQSLTLSATLMPGPESVLWFSSEFTAANAQQIATVELSEDDGHSWVTIWEQVPDTSKDGYPEPVTIPLGQYERRALKLRFAFADVKAGAPQLAGFEPAAALWRLDAVELRDVSALVVGQASFTEHLDRFSLVADLPGPLLLQVQPLLFGGYPGEWSPFTAVEATGITPADAQRDQQGVGLSRYSSRLVSNNAEALPDLVVKSLANPGDTEVGLGESIVAIFVDIENKGTADAGPFVTHFYLSNPNGVFLSTNPIGTCSAGGLKAGQVGRCTGKFNTQGGNSVGLLLRAVVNPPDQSGNRQVNESDVTNNTTVVKIEQGENSGGGDIPAGSHSPERRPGNNPTTLRPSIQWLRPL